MGVDVSAKVRIYAADNSYKEIKVSDQDNSLGSIFNSNEIAYTSIAFDKAKELSDDENKLMELFPDDENEMLMRSAIINASAMTLIFEKIAGKLYYRKEKH